MPRFHTITALCTPLTDDEQVHLEGLEAHIQDQIDNGINGLLVGGTMGVMQLLTERTYLELVRHSVRFNAGRAEVLVGVGDTSYARTRDRIKMVDDLPIDGVVILAPFCIKFRQPELIHYFQSLADVSRKPVYLYDLPQMTGTKLEIETVLTLARHPNIFGIKCSDQFANTRPLLDAHLEPFRVIVAQPLLMDILLRSGVREHLDGIFGLAPHWIKWMVQRAEVEDWTAVGEIQKDISELLHVLLNFPAPLFACAAELQRQRGFPGNIAPAPLRRLPPAQVEEFRQTPVIRKLVQNTRAKIA